jgi:hypothetical protein
LEPYALAFLTEDKELYDLYEQAKNESKIWRKDYHEFERLAENGLLEDLDPDLPETNDGTLAASLYKLPKRIINSTKKGRASALDADDAWITELANMQWEKNIIPNANSQAPFHRKWKDAVRKAAIYGSVPLITLFVERGDYIGSDFVVAQPQDVKLEPGKVSDYDSDVFFWDVYFTKQQVVNMVERAEAENKEAKENNDESYNKWDVKALKDILSAKQEEESRDSDEDHRDDDDNSVRQKGIKFCTIFQRGVDAPFYMYHPATKKKVREWSNPDPSGDVPIHFLYCYQDFINPYGVGIVKLAGGTQNVLDTMRQYDVLATQLGLRPPVSIGGDLSQTDLDSIVYGTDAQWMVGNATVKREEISTQIYQSLPDRISMYKTSLNQMIPTGDTSISASAGDPNYSKTPAGVKFQEQSLSIDDEDFKDNVDMTYEAVAKSMINTHFANMQGTDLMKLDDDERDILIKAGLEFPVDEMGEPLTNELEIIWDEARATFNFEMDAESDQTKDEEQRLDALLKVVELRATDPLLEQTLMDAGKKLNVGELFSEIISLTTKNDKIIEDISPEDMAEQEEAMGVDPVTGQPIVQPDVQEDEQLAEEPAIELDPEDEQELVNIQAIAEEYGVSENIASAMREAEMQGATEEQIHSLANRLSELEAASV